MNIIAHHAVSNFKYLNIMEFHRDQNSARSEDDCSNKCESNEERFHDCEEYKAHISELSKDDNTEGKINDENHNPNKEYQALKRRVDQLQTTANNLTTQVSQLKNENINYIDLINGSITIFNEYKLSMDKWKAENAVEIDRISKEIDKLKNKDASSPLNSKKKFHCDSSTYENPDAKTSFASILLYPRTEQVTTLPTRRDKSADNSDNKSSRNIGQFKTSIPQQPISPRNTKPATAAINNHKKSSEIKKYTGTNDKYSSLNNNKNQSKKISVNLNKSAKGSRLSTFKRMSVASNKK